MQTDIDYLRLAIEQAKKSVKQGGFPAGAIVVKDGEVIAEGISTGFKYNDPSGHAETAVIRTACTKLQTADLSGTTLYASIQSCLMCFSVAYWAGVSRLVYAVEKTPGMVSKEYYEGTTDIQKVNEENNHQVGLIYLPELEQESLAVIEDWEKQGGFSQ